MSAKREQKPLRTELEPLVDALARRLARQFLEGKLPALDEAPPAIARVAARPKRKAA